MGIGSPCNAHACAVFQVAVGIGIQIGRVLAFGTVEMDIANATNTKNRKLVFFEWQIDFKTNVLVIRQGSAGAKIDA